MANKKINKKATIEKILKAAEGHINDINEFNELMKTEENIEDAAALWDVEIIYE
jgi:hypothetical protein